MTDKSDILIRTAINNTTETTTTTVISTQDDDTKSGNISNISNKHYTITTSSDRMPVTESTECLYTSTEANNDAQETIANNSAKQQVEP